MKRIFLLAIVISTSVMASVAQDKNYVEWYLQRPDLDIYVREEGEGRDTVIVVHGGFGANHNYMLDVISGIKDRYHFILYDQRGSLLSPCKKENLTFQKNVDDLFALVKALRVKKVKLLCHGMGSLLGMEFIKQHEGLVSKAVFVSSIIPQSDSMRSVFSDSVYKHIFSLQLRPEVQKLLKPYNDKGYENITSFEDLDSSELTHRQVTEVWRINFAATNLYDMNKYHLIKGGRAFLKSEATAMMETVPWNFDYRPVLSKLEGVTFIQGDHDFYDFNGEMHRHQLKNYPKLKLEVIQKAGHYIWVDEPVKFNALLTEGLK